MTAFSEWVDKVSKAHGYETDYAMARAIGVSHTAPPRWRTSNKPPELETLRKVATAFHAPMQEVLVAAGYLLPEEAGVVPMAPRIELASDEELLAEVARRMGKGGSANRDVVVAMRSAAPFDPAELDREPPRPKPRS